MTPSSYHAPTNGASRSLRERRLLTYDEPLARFLIAKGHYPRKTFTPRGPRFFFDMTAKLAEDIRQYARRVGVPISSVLPNRFASF